MRQSQWQPWPVRVVRTLVRDFAGSEGMVNIEKQTIEFLNLN